MNKDKYYDFILNGISVSKSEEIIFRIVNDLADRRGLGNEWEVIDEDIQNEIITKWISIANKLIA